MPEMIFRVRWPDDSLTDCYSPSLVIRDHLREGAVYPLEEFTRISREALTIASDRVAERYGFPCSRAARQIGEIEAKAARFAALPAPTVTVVAFS
ncbi:MSMEG_0570 family nitrogen starvation response protein [Azospirillum rugosum]|uniref:Repeat protein (TIGR04042 family) n=1 Tax=Azospirillum rugosum TaxID=416170 RepID=A0ABS4SME7_9PROT|nr:MSMEG_0570 family nitrogen starvation response protein [Azospirillum rugosum]MBP2293726.1 putative repeat protein (TIGR04042 family) [Azospirillum rugosum]MDQ0527271.1 putative repeat protein (TIGR04042 family) [Azospirillum rugosum]